MIATALAAFNAATIWIKAAIVGSVVITVAGGLIYMHHTIEQSGYDRAIREVAADNSEALTRVQKARRESNACNDIGRHWDQSDGVCRE